MGDSQNPTNSVMSLLLGVAKVLATDEGETGRATLEIVSTSRTNSFEDISRNLYQRKQDLLKQLKQDKKRLKSLLAEISSTTAELNKVEQLLSRL